MDSKKIFSLCFLLSVISHGAVAAWFLLQPEPGVVAENRAISVTISQHHKASNESNSQPPPAPKTEVKDSVRPPVKKIVKKTTEPVKKKTAIVTDKVTPNPIIPQQKDTVEESVIAETETEQIETEENVEATTTATSHQESVPDKPQQASSAANSDHSNYTAELKAAIAAHKHYPILARRRGKQGEVFVAFTINRDGSFEKIAIKKSSGIKILDKAAKRTIEKLGSFRPLPDSIKTSYLNIILPMDFSLK